MKEKSGEKKRKGNELSQREKLSKIEEQKQEEAERIKKLKGKKNCVAKH